MVEQPGVPAPGTYTYLSDSPASPAEEEDLLLPGAQSAWGNEIAPPPPEPVVEAVHEPGPHETAGRDSGSVDLGGVRLPEPPQPAPRRPLHLGPPIPDLSAGPVRSLADRGPADLPTRQAGPPTVGPEYLDVPRAREATAPQAAAPWGAQATVGAGAAAAETVVPSPEPVDAAQAFVTRVATEAVAAQDTGGAAGDPGHGVPTDTGGTGTAAQHTAPGTLTAEGDGTRPTAPVATPGQAPATEAPQAAAPGHAPTAEAAAPESGESAQAAVPEQAQGPQRTQGPEEGPVTDAAPVEAVSVQGTAPAQAEQQVPGAEAAPAATAVGVPSAEAPAQDFAQEPGAEAAAPGTVPVAEAPQEPASGEVPSAPAVGPEQVQAAEASPSVAEPAAAEDPQGLEAPGAEAAVTEHAPVAEAPQAPAPGEAPSAQAAAEEVQVTEGVSGAEGATPEAVEAPAEPQAVQAPVFEAPAPEPVQDVQEAQPAPAPEADALPATAPAEADTTEPVAAASADVPVPDAPAEAPASQPVPAEAAVAAGTTAAEAPAPAPAEAPAPQPVPAPTEAVAAAGTTGAEAPEPAPADAPPAGTPEALDHPAGQAVDAAAVTEPVPDLGPVSGTDAPTPPAAEAEANAETAPAPAPAPVTEDAHPVQGPQQTPAPLPGTVPLHPDPDQPLGQFVPVEGTVPTTPHLAPTPPQGVTVPAAPDAEPAQSPDDLDTQGAGVEPDAEAEPARHAGPAAPAYDDAEREAVLKVMRERRDIRNGFRSDPIPHEVLLRVLEAAHTAPSVGHSQPWDFVVIRSAETRRGMHELAMRQRDAYAKSLPKGRAKQFKELKIEAILDTPVNIVVTADPTRGGRHTLGRHTQPQMAPYSSALAVENLWLAARAEGLGVGWVSFFDEREMVRALGLPEHLEVVAYLCVGYVDEFPDEPELMQAGWSKRRPLSWVVHEETYGRRALPGEEPHDLLAETVAQIRPLDAKALGEAWERQKRMTKPAGALGMLEIISAQLSGLSRQCPPPIPEPAAVAIFAGDHGVHAQGVTPWPQEVTAQMVANFLGGGAVCNAFAAQVGAEVCVVDVGVSTDLPATPGLLPRKIRAGTSDMTTGPAMTREEVKKAIEVGIETARDLVAAGNKALLTGEMGIANTTASAALISVFTGADPAEVTGRGTGINDETLARKTEVVRRALELHQPDPADPIGVLAAVGGFEHAAMVGLLLGGASLRTPVILDGVSAGAAALVARAIAPEVLAACIAGHRSAEPGHVAALNKLGLRPLVDLDLRLGEGTGALLALPLVQSTARAMHEVATFDSAGVTEK
ncbi:hypothetical protein GCM10017779_28580 [Streptomyces capillispiralis]|nr:hypothetical protein GCM10017779_28580 [Streptomyces capillispiralis]